MNKRAHHFLLVLIALAVAIAPLRGALAIPSMSDADSGAHCAEMQDAMHATHDMAAMPHATEDGQGCDGECCDGACNACVQGTVAYSAPTAVMVDIDASPFSRTPLRSFPGLTVHPPFRPPISLRA